MLCEIARKLSADELSRIEALERDLGLIIVAFSCRTLDPEREERLRRIMEELGPPLRVAPAETDEAQLSTIRETEATLGVALVAVQADLKPV
jgi:phosphoribosylamine-glycine ligase